MEEAPTELINRLLPGAINTMLLRSYGTLNSKLPSKGLELTVDTLTG
jgi:hypothetical protein